MKKALSRSLMTVWVLVATIMLARFWLTYHYLFPQVPIPFFIWISEQYGAANGEEMADVELLVGLAGAFIVVLVVTLVGLRIWRQTRPQPMPDQASITSARRRGS